MPRRGATGGGMCPSSRCAKQEGSEGGRQYGVTRRVMEGAQEIRAVAFQWGDGQIHVLLGANPCPALCCLLPSLSKSRMGTPSVASTDTHLEGNLMPVKPLLFESLRVIWHQVSVQGKQ